MMLEVVDAQNTLTLARNAYDDGQVHFQVGPRPKRKAEPDSFMVAAGK
jgi:hypothetical protein